MGSSRSTRLNVPLGPLYPPQGRTRDVAQDVEGSLIPVKLDPDVSVDGPPQREPGWPAFRPRHRHRREVDARTDRRVRQAVVDRRLAVHLDQVDQAAAETKPAMRAVIDLRNPQRFGVGRPDEQAVRALPVGAEREVQLLRQRPVEENDLQGTTRGELHRPQCNLFEHDRDRDDRRARQPRRVAELVERDRALVEGDHSRAVSADGKIPHDLEGGHGPLLRVIGYDDWCRERVRPEVDDHLPLGGRCRGDHGDDREAVRHGGTNLP